jgi:hypothetical protein
VFDLEPGLEPANQEDLSMSSRRLHVGLACFAVVYGSGCSRGPELVEVEGTLKLRGKPLANVMVSFIPDTEQGTAAPCSTGMTDGQGRYSLMCDQPDKPGRPYKPGAVLGKHRIIVLFPESFDELPEPQRRLLEREGGAAMSASRAPQRPEQQQKVLDPAGEDLRSQAMRWKPKPMPFGSKYTSLAQTPLRAELRAPGPQTVDLNLE